MYRLCLTTYVLIFAALNAGCYAAENQPAQTPIPKLYMYSLNTISQTPGQYYGWPTVTRTTDGELLAVYSGGRDWHVCPFGRIELIRSSDNGQTWSKPEVLIDSILDDRDTGICQTQNGTLLVTWFTSTYWIDWWLKNKKEKQKSEEQDKWQKMLDQIEAGQYRYKSIENQAKARIQSTKGQVVDQWMIRSEDNGQTWSRPYRVPLMSPHGPIATTKGTLLLAGKDADEKWIALCESTDDGKTWRQVSRIPPMPGHDVEQYHELHIAEAADGTLVVQIRNHNEKYNNETLQTESKDGGKTWTQVHSIGVEGHPSHLLRMQDNTLLMTYGHRPVFRVEARISTDNGSTWSDPLIIANNLNTWDFGYPSTIQLNDGKLLTIWYEVTPDSPRAVIRQALWKNNNRTGE